MPQLEILENDFNWEGFFLAPTELIEAQKLFWREVMKIGIEAFDYKQKQGNFCTLPTQNN